VFIQLSLEEKEKFIKDRYNGKCRLSGKTAAVIKKIESIINNTKSNPEKLVAVEGIWASNQLLKYNVEIKAVVLDLDSITSQDAYKIMIDLSDIAEEIHIVSSSTYKKIAEIGTSAGIYVLAKFPQKALSDLNPEKHQVIAVLDGLEIPGNIGTIIRSCDGTNTGAVIICNRKTRITHPKILRSSQASCFKIPIVEDDTIAVIEWLKKNNYRIILTDTDAKKFYYEESYEGKIAIIMGSERYGISRQWYEIDAESIKIPMYGDCDSLNVGIAATLILYEVAISRTIGPRN
jgi:TrmH family RNA methyltransferase